MRGPHQILCRPCMTEKSSMLADGAPVVVFEVVRDANKVEIASAVKSAFDVDVMSVRTMIVRGKSKRRGRIVGRRQNWKKAIVTLGEGQSIDFFGTASSV
ncbi:MAG: 50S ribosomal protein L23 [Deltaproteobacteria bacterium]|nr:50S ribosomal protein L23 [Deltaproteobacteria bacterium]